MNSTAFRYLRNGRDRSGRAIDIAVEADTIVAVTEAAGASAPASNETDLGGRLVLPGLIDGHLHLDKTFLGMAWLPHSAGPAVIERIDNEVTLQSAIAEPVEARACRLVELGVSNGTVALRTHVDIDETKRLAHLHAVLRAREACRGIADIQIVAFPQSGVVRQPAVARLLEEAIAEGADLIGALDPATIDNDIAGQLECVFAIAGRHGVGVDLHLHNVGETGIAEVEAVVEYTHATGLQGMVTLSHAYCLGSAEHHVVRRLADRLAGADIAVVTAAPGAIPLPPLDILRQAGVRVFAGSDNVRDAWSPFGNADMLERLMLIAYRSGYRRDEDIEGTLAYATSNAAAALGLRDYGLEPGCRADLVAVSAECATEAIAARPTDRLVFKAGRLVARDGHCLQTAEPRLRI